MVFIIWIIAWWGEGKRKRKREAPQKTETQDSPRFLWLSKIKRRALDDDLPAIVSWGLVTNSHVSVS